MGMEALSGRAKVLQVLAAAAAGAALRFCNCCSCGDRYKGPWGSAAATPSAMAVMGAAGAFCAAAAAAGSCGLSCFDMDPAADCSPASGPMMGSCCLLGFEPQALSGNCAVVFLVSELLDTYHDRTSPSVMPGG
eukprot:1139180-Pelagomonas_calceolata.AAC.3